MNISKEGNENFFRRNLPMQNNQKRYGTKTRSCFLVKNYKTHIYHSDFETEFVHSKHSNQDLIQETRYCLM